MLNNEPVEHDMLYNRETLKQAPPEPPTGQGAFKGTGAALLGTYENFTQNPFSTSALSTTSATTTPRKHFKLQNINYRPEFAEQMVDFFNSKEKTKIVVETMSWKNGEVREIEKEVPLPPPQFADFAHSIGVTERKLKSWARSYPDFNEAYEWCREVYESFLIHNGITGGYGAQFTTFVATNKTHMKIKTFSENHVVNMKDVLDHIEKGTIKPADGGFAGIGGASAVIEGEDL